MYRSDRWLNAKLRSILGHSNFEALVHWIHAAREQPPVLFVGAGFSLNARPKPTAPASRMKTWSELTADLRRDLGEGESSVDSLWIAEKYKQLFPAHTLHTKILNAVPDGDVEPGTQHFALGNLDWHAVLTLNYDTLLERALEGRQTRRVTEIVFQEQLTRVTASSCLPVIHLHGHIQHPSTIVLSLEDFRRYPEDRAVFLTVAQQLLFQHPVLFLGFGASDPNFVAWSGWIRDRLGTHAPPWVRLQPDFGREDAGMERYWAPRLTTVSYNKLNPGMQFERLLEVMGQALKPLDAGRREFLLYVSELVGATRDPGSPGDFFLEVLEETERSLREQYPPPHTWIVRLNRSNPLIRLLQHELKENGLTKAQVEELTASDREEREPYRHREMLHPKSEPSAPYGAAEWRKAEVRRLMGRKFLPWLVAAVRLSGPVVPLANRGLTLDALEEYQLQDAKEDATNSSLLRQLGLLTLPYELERHTEDALEPTAVTWLRLGSLDELSIDEAAIVEDLIQRTKWLRGEDCGETVHTENAQGARRVAFLEELAGELGAAARGYERATQLSIREGEPAPIQFMTAQSAHDLLFNVKRSDDELDVETRLSGVRSQLDLLRERASRFVRDQTEAERDHLANRTKDLNSEVEGLLAGEPDGTIYRARIEPMAPFFEFLEDYWMSPQLVARKASAVALARWESEKTSAVTLLARYHCPELSLFTRREVDAPRRVPVPVEMVTELLRRSRWPDEERVRISATALLVPELPDTERNAMFERCLESLAHRSGSGPSQVRGEAEAKLLLALGAYTPWSEFRSWVQRIREVVDGELARLAHADWGELPLHLWSNDEAFDGPAADDYFAILAALHSPRGFPMTDVIEMLADTILRGEVRLPPDGQAALLLSSWLDAGTPQNDAIEWLRTEAVLALEVVQGASVRVVRAARERMLFAIVEQQIQSGIWPSSYTVRAWLSCLDGSPPDDGIARRLLEVPFPPMLEPFSRPTADVRMNARVRLRLWAELQSVSAEDNQAAAAFLLEVMQQLPETLEDFASIPLNEVAEPLRGIFVAGVSDLFATAGALRARTYPARCALGVLAATSECTALESAPREWLAGAAGLTTSVHPTLASVACGVLATCAMRWANEWTSVHADLLAEIRRALLRATTDGRAYVVAAAVGALLDVQAIATPLLREHLTEHLDTRTRLECLEADERMAVVAARREWTRDTLAPRSSAPGNRFE